MGKPPVPPWTTIYERINEDKYIPKWETCIELIKRFIDDGYAMWNPPAEISDEESTIKFNEFKTVVNNNKGLNWEFTELSSSVNLLDLTLKPLALHFYLLPHSMHPPGVLTSHVFNSEHTENVQTQFT